MIQTIVDTDLKIVLLYFLQSFFVHIYGSFVFHFLSIARVCISNHIDTHELGKRDFFSQNWPNFDKIIAVIRIVLQKHTRARADGYW